MNSLRGLSFLFLCGCLTAGTISVQLQREPGVLSKWAGNHLIDVQGSGTASIVFRIYERDGSESRTVPFLIPGALHITIRDSSMNGSGRLAAVGHWTGEKGAGGDFLAIIPPFGSPLIVGTAGESFSAVAIDKAGDAWAFGTGARNSAILRRCDTSGHMSGLPLNPPAIRNLISAQLQATRQGLYLYLPYDARLIHIDSGEIVGDVTGIEFRGVVNGGMAVTEGGGVFSSATMVEQRRARPVLVRLDQSSRHWVVVDRPEDMQRLVGADGEQLVGRRSPAFDLSFWDLPR